MRNKVVLTSNVDAFMGALRTLQTRSEREEGMGLLWGLPGEGKSTTISHVAIRTDAIFLRARVTWTVSTMLRALSKEMQLEEGRYRDPMIERIVESLSRLPRPIFIDEADYLFRQTDMLDALRDIYDDTKVPIILVGMEDIARKIRSHYRFNRFERRITQWIEFKGLSLGDVRKVARELCEVELEDDLIEHIHKQTEGNIGNVVIALAKVEKFGSMNALPLVTLADYGSRPLK